MGNPNGRPPCKAPRTVNLKVRLNEGEAFLLQTAAEILETTKTDVIAEGIKKVYDEAVAKQNKQK